MKNEEEMQAQEKTGDSLPEKQENAGSTALTATETKAELPAEKYEDIERIISEAENAAFLEAEKRKGCDETIRTGLGYKGTKRTPSDCRS